MKILLTGGAGYIGSHTLIELLSFRYTPIVVDNLSNSSKKSLHRIKELTGYDTVFYQVDIRDQTKLNAVFQTHQDIDAVIHFAGLKAVGESVEKPLHYFDNNINGTLSLLQVMSDFNCKKLVFSSSATVYGEPTSVPIKEHFPTSVTNPYGRTKLMIEEILNDLYISDNTWSIGILRYFNPVGAHKSGLIGEDPNDIPNNLMPYISQVAVGKREYLRIFGDDYPTKDGTGIRDYIHVVDLAKGHVKALHALKRSKRWTVNLGTGKGYSVLDVVKTFEKASNRKIPYKIVTRRPGDIAKCYADPTLAYKKLGWKAELGLDKMCEDAWRWQSNNPNGYNT